MAKPVKKGQGTAPTGAPEAPKPVDPQPTPLIPPVAPPAAPTPTFHGGMKKPGNQLDPLDRAIISQFVRNPTITNAAVAQILGIAAKTVTKRMKNPQFIEMMDETMLPTLEVWKRSTSQVIRRAIEHVQARGSDEAENRSVRMTAAAIRHIIPVKVDVSGKVDGVVTLADFIRGIPDADPEKVPKSGKRKGVKA